MKFETKQLSDGKLTTQMIDQYKSDGFLYPIKILEIEEACTLRKELELIEEKFILFDELLHSHVNPNGKDIDVMWKSSKVTVTPPSTVSNGKKNVISSSYICPT